MSMVLGHAPVILPAVLRVRLPHHRRDYAVLALLHVSFALRIVGGDLAGVDALRVLGGSLGVVTLLAFVANAIASIVGASRASTLRPPSPRTGPLVTARGSAPRDDAPAPDDVATDAAAPKEQV
jgi:hypothetical protein